MNKERRTAIDDIQSSLDDIEQQIQDVMDEEQDAFDNLPGSLQYSQRGEDITGRMFGVLHGRRHFIYRDNTFPQWEKELTAAGTVADSHNIPF